jgi:hypothetical protein
MNLQQFLEIAEVWSADTWTSPDYDYQTKPYTKLCSNQEIVKTNFDAEQQYALVCKKEDLFLVISYEELINFEDYKKHLLTGNNFVPEYKKPRKGFYQIQNLYKELWEKRYDKKFWGVGEDDENERELYSADEYFDYTDNL